MAGIVWGLDIGGTKCAVCAADEQGKILFRRQIATRDYPRWQDVLETLVQYGKESGFAPMAVGVSCGGPLDSEKGLVLSPPQFARVGRSAGDQMAGRKITGARLFAKRRQCLRLG